MDHMEIHSRGGCLPNYERVGDLADLLEKSQGYKFVFAIENSLCTEYVTEKLSKFCVLFFKIHFGDFVSVFNCSP